MAKIRKFAATCVLFFTHFFEQGGIFPCSLVHLFASIIILIGVMIDCNKLLAYYLCGETANDTFMNLSGLLVNKAKIFIILQMRSDSKNIFHETPSHACMMPIVNFLIDVT